MKYLMTSLICLSLCILIFCLAMPVRAETDSGKLIPAGVTITGTYQPGVGEAVGEITQVSGKVGIIHKDDTKGYWARKGDRLFKGDTVVTLQDAFAAFMLNDGSFMTLASETKLQVAKSVYAPKKRSRSAFINMMLGKTRFIVKKLVDARHSEFKVKTATSVAGVRGSDFIIAASEASTKITTLKDTELEVISLAAPSAPPAVLTDYEQTTIAKGALPEEARKVSAQEVDRMMKEFKFHPSKSAPGAGLEQPQGQAQAEKTALPPKEVYQTMVVSDDELVKPDSWIPRAEINQLPLNDRFGIKSRIIQERKVENQRTVIFDQKHEFIIKRRLPDFPGTP